MLNAERSTPSKCNLTIHRVHISTQDSGKEPYKTTTPADTSSQSLTSTIDLRQQSQWSAASKSLNDYSAAVTASSRAATATIKSPQVKMKVFDGGHIADVSVETRLVANTSVVSSSARSPKVNQKTIVPNNGFHANPMPSSLKKINNANQSLERYLKCSATNGISDSFEKKSSDRTNKSRGKSSEKPKSKKNKQLTVVHTGSFKSLNSEEVTAGNKFESLGALE